MKATDTADTLDARAWALAQSFHSIYERLAPSFGYETRPETRGLVPDSPNGKLMQATCAELIRQGLIAEAKCRLCHGVGSAFLDDPWGGVYGTCPDCHGTGKS